MAAGVFSRSKFIQLGIVRRAMGDQITRFRCFELGQGFGDLRFRIFSGGIERRGITVTETGPGALRIRAGGLDAPVKINQTIFFAEGRGLLLRFMVSRDHPHTFRERTK